MRDVEHAMDQLALGTKQLGINLRISSTKVKTIGEKPEKASMKKVGWPQKNRSNNFQNPSFLFKKILRLGANFLSFGKITPVKRLVKCTWN